MGLLSGLFKRKEQTREELIIKVTNELLKASLKPDSYVSSLPLAEGQSRDYALAEWYALTLSIFHYALAVSLGTADKISPIIDMYRSALPQHLNPNCKNKFLEIVAVREKEYVMGISETLSSQDEAEAMKLFRSMVARITGHFDEELEKLGLPTPDGPDIITVAGFFQLVMGRIIAEKELVRGLEEQIPRLFSGPMN